MRKIAISGNIGSGKSIVCKIFALLKVPVYYADNEAKKFYNDEEVRILISEKFGIELLNTDNTINLKLLTSIVFNNNHALADLNNIIHPRVMADFKNWIESQKLQNKYVVMESAIIFETGLFEKFDKVIVVAANEDKRIKRIIARDGISKQQISERQQNQWKQSRKIKMADYVIFNNDNNAILPQIIKIHNELSIG